MEIKYFLGGGNVFAKCTFNEDKGSFFRNRPCLHYHIYPTERGLECAPASVESKYVVEFYDTFDELINYLASSCLCPEFVTTHLEEGFDGRGKVALCGVFKTFW